MVFLVLMPITARRPSRARHVVSSHKSEHSDPDAQDHDEGTDTVSPLHEASSSHRASGAGTSLRSGSLRNRCHTRPNHIRARESHREHHHDFDLHAGAEPGINPLSGSAIAEYGHFQQECVIDVVDYDCDDIAFRELTNEGLLALLAEGGGAGALPTRMVRWINIGGVDWSVLSALAVKYRAVHFVYTLLSTKIFEYFVKTFTRSRWKISSTSADTTTPKRITTQATCLSGSCPIH